MAFLHLKWDFQRANSQKNGISSHVVLHVLKKISGNWTTRGKKKPPKNNLQLMNSIWKWYPQEIAKNCSKEPRQDMRYASGPSVDPSTVHWSLIRNGLCERMAVKKPFLKKRNGEKRLRYTKTTQEVDWKSVATDLMEGWILPRARASTFLKQCGIILTENRTKGSRHPKKSSGMSFKSPRELFLKTSFAVEYFLSLL